MNDFKYRQFRGLPVWEKLSCKLFVGTLKYEMNYRDLEEMILARGVEVDHTILYRWVQKYAPELYELKTDREQRTNIADQHLEKMAEFKAIYDD
ncbi:MAG: hypothetical protein KTR26_16465 [Flammeovirgaceae bacterium]|nr:hypothetical protein [Flammeovirgaceae bacterium]